MTFLFNSKITRILSFEELFPFYSWTKIITSEKKLFVFFPMKYFKTTWNLRFSKPNWQEESKRKMWKDNFPNKKIKNAPSWFAKVLWTFLNTILFDVAFNSNRKFSSAIAQRNMAFMVIQRKFQKSCFIFNVLIGQVFFEIFFVSLCAVKHNNGEQIQI